MPSAYQMVKDAGGFGVQEELNEAREQIAKLKDALTRCLPAIRMHANMGDAVAAEEALK